ncbi:MAG TPA: beta-N-acetylhexosaminidase [Gemmatimonadaceae bacterium]|nr:beta-N-acetylhexosaminidase [Gemmatimonadaceae bacterium]
MKRAGRLAAALVAVLLAGRAVAACGTPAAAHVTDLPGPTTDAHNLVPAPRSVLLSATDSFVVLPQTVIGIDSEGDSVGLVARHLAELVGRGFGGGPLRIAAGNGSGHNTIALGLAPAGTMPAEGYELTIAPGGVTIAGGSAAGLFYGSQTLRQLLPPVAESRTAGTAMALPVGRIVDSPRFEWRGAMLDVSRHFLPAADVKRYIDLMALHKLNRLHLHLSDDQGWRIQIRSWPNLTARGGSTQVGGGPGGFYTQAEYADLVSYAHDRFITVVPEIDMPGHTNAALASYAVLNCDGVARPLYTGTRVGFSALCVQRETTYKFVDDVVREIAALTPGPYFHIGGDEVERLTAAQYRTFIERVEKIVHSHGKQMIGWGEIAPANLSATTIVQHWKPNSNPRVAVARGSKVIMSPANRIYLDMKYDSTTRLGLTWAGVTEIWDAYGWDPATFITGVPEESILGVEGPLWSETVVTIRDFEYLAFPRLAAVAEIGWTPQAQRNWDDFRRRLGAQGPRWRALGINFHRSPRVPWQ